MRCSCSHCLELAARGANVELLKCAALDVGLDDSPIHTANLELVPRETSPSHQLQLSGSVELTSRRDRADLEDPNDRPYLWELIDEC